MRNPRAYYSSDIYEFLNTENAAILGVIHSNDASAKTTIQQSNAWEEEVIILKEVLKGFEEGRIIFEYTIPRMGKRVDNVLLYKNIVFLLEFKCGQTEYLRADSDQVWDYALDLKNFHRLSHDKIIIPILVATRAKNADTNIEIYEGVAAPFRANRENLGYIIQKITEHFTEPRFSYTEWENSDYLPTPTIIEAAQALYRGHNVQDITRNDAGAENLTVTTDEINRIIEHSKEFGRKSICFVTGVPGAGKTLVGLNIAIQRRDARKGEHAVFLSGNLPLVTVLQEALARDKVRQEKELGNKIRKQDATRMTKSFIQIIHKYRDSFVGNRDVPPEKIVIFDEAQRAWTKEEISKFMLTKKGIPDFSYSEPEFLISTMDRHRDWAVIICLVGGGQEINTGEAGMPEWFRSLRRSFVNWDVYVTEKLRDEEYSRGQAWEEIVSGLRVSERPKLHLSTSIRSFRTPLLADFVKALLDTDREKAIYLHRQIKEKYPIVITRDLKRAKMWVKEKCKGTTRYGLIASSGGLRLKPEGIFVKNEVSVANWFLNGKEDVRSSYSLEDVVTEFDIQGLELDYTIVAWDADLRFSAGEWVYYNFTGDRWNNINKEEKRLYLKNAYRVLLTRARQGMAIFVPKGSDEDRTREKSFYDGTFEYLKSLGIKEI